MNRTLSKTCVHGHPMDGTTKGRRYCKTCNRLRVKVWAKNNPKKMKI